MKKYPFRFVAKQGAAGIIEVVRDGTTERCILPMDIIQNANSELSDAQINAGIPYGIPFADFLSPQAESALHNVGIWTSSELYSKAKDAVGALNSVGIKLSDAIKAAEIYEKQDHTIVFKAAPTAPKLKVKKEKYHD